MSTKEEIVARLLDEKHITIVEAVVLLKSEHVHIEHIYTTVYRENDSLQPIGPNPIYPQIISEPDIDWPKIIYGTLIPNKSDKYLSILNQDLNQDNSSHCESESKSLI